MPFGKYNDRENFWYGFDLPHSKESVVSRNVNYTLSHLRKRYGCADDNANSEYKDAVIGLAASLLLQGFGIATKLLLKESGIKVDTRTIRMLNYAGTGGQVILEARTPEKEPTESFTDNFLRKIKT